MKITDLKAGIELKNKNLCEIFKCGTRSGMRRSLKTNSLVLVSDHTKSFYEDVWNDEVFYYTGMGLTGDQSLDFMQNKTLANSKENCVDLHLFEVFSPGSYMYQGQVELNSNPFQEIQHDHQGNKRSVWIFPLKLKNQEKPVLIPEETFNDKEEKKLRKAKKLSLKELRKRATILISKKKTQKVISERYVRNEYVVEYVKARAKGICELCNNPAPFIDKNKIPFLEVHHIKWLSKNGKDTVNNTVALCPNCHRKMHFLELDKDKKILLLKANFKIDNNSGQ